MHGLLTRGLQIAERLLPGVAEELRGLGAVDVDMGADVAIRNAFGWSTRFPSQVRTLSMTRGLFEWVVRQRVIDNVPVVRGRVDGLLGASDRVTGVRIGDRELRADLVVDASGRASTAPRRLSGLGIVPPEEKVVDAHLGYATRVYRIPDSHSADWRVLYVQLGAGQTRGGLLCPIEGGRWQLTLCGLGDDRPPTDEEGFTRFAKGLVAPDIAEAVAAAQPLTGVVGTRATSNRRRYFERRPVRGFVVLGDALCSFNPVYGQGMTMGLLGSDLLGECLRAGELGDFQARLGALTNVPWDMATHADARFPGTEGLSLRRRHRLMAAYVDRLVLAGNSDPVVQEEFLHVVGLLRPATRLLLPGVVARVIRTCVSSRRRGADGGD
ncbi:hypothetical protein Lesp02_36780 [Lentzea sp. NBRC 105346]|nr:hypothetical protein Lesp02_36780 [Lentzea sp. NBRC 105346]